MLSLVATPIIFIVTDVAVASLPAEAVTAVTLLLLWVCAQTLAVEGAVTFDAGTTCEACFVEVALTKFTYEVAHVRSLSICIGN